MVSMHITHGTNAMHVTLLYINAPHTIHITLWYVIGETVMIVVMVETVFTGETVVTVVTDMTVVMVETVVIGGQL